MEITKEQIEQLQACTTVEELKAFAESLGDKITDEQALATLKMMDAHRSTAGDGKVSDDALADVDGGFDWVQFGVGFGISAMGVGFTCALFAATLFARK